MSLSSPECFWCRSPLQSMLGASLLAALALSSAIGVTSAHAAQTYWQPHFEAGVEQNSNRNLAPDAVQEADVTGYVATAEILWGYLTPRTDTQIQPRLRFQRYPDQDDADRSEQFLDFRTAHRATERTSYEVVARYSRQDAFRTELGGAEFDDFDPEDPTEGVDGSPVTGADTRTRIQLRPNVTHQFTELTGIAVSGLAQAIRFDSDILDRTDYDYFELRTLLTRQQTPRTEWSGGPMVARFETRDGSNQTDDFGLELAVSHRWSELVRFGAGAFVRRSDIEIVRETEIGTETQTNYGFDVSLIRQTELGRIRLSAGRRLQPNSGGSMTTTDEVRAQYDHDFSERVSMRTALRAYTQDAVGSFAGGDGDRDYARAELGLTWMLTPTIYLRGRYNYTWREIARDETSTNNHAVVVSVGYQGLGRPR
jgi:hypothetical protein